MFPCSDWVTTPILENIPDSLGDSQRVKTYYILVDNVVMNRITQSSESIRVRIAQLGESIIYKSFDPVILLLICLSTLYVVLEMQ